MKKTLYLKFILAYFIFGVFSFIIVSVFVPNMTQEHLVREKAEALYSEATLISNTYATGLYTSETDLETVKTQLDFLAVYLDSTIRIINPSGRLVLDTNTPLNVDLPSARVASRSARLVMLLEPGTETVSGVSAEKASRLIPSYI